MGRVAFRIDGTRISGRASGRRLGGPNEIVVVLAPAAVESMTLPRFGDKTADVLGVRLAGEVGVAEAAVIVGEEVRKVLPNEAQVGRTGARLEEERVGGEEAGVGLGGVAGHAVDRVFGIGDSRQQG